MATFTNYEWRMWQFGRGKWLHRSKKKVLFLYFFFFFLWKLRFCLRLWLQINYCSIGFLSSYEMESIYINVSDELRLAPYPNNRRLALSWLASGCSRTGWCGWWRALPATSSYRRRRRRRCGAKSWCSPPPTRWSVPIPPSSASSWLWGGSGTTRTRTSSSSTSVPRSTSSPSP